MPAHDNIYIPTESFPHWIWFMIEFAIVFAVSAVLSREVMIAFQDLVEPMRNWIFWGLFTAFFSGWYFIIRGLILKKPILQR